MPISEPVEKAEEDLASGISFPCLTLSELLSLFLLPVKQRDEKAKENSGGGGRILIPSLRCIYGSTGFLTKTSLPES